MANYTLTRNPVTGPGTDNLTNPPNLSSQAVSMGLGQGTSQWRFVQLTYTVVQSLAATGVTSALGDTLFLPDTDWCTAQVYLSGTATYSIEGTCAPANVVAGNFTGGTVAWLPIASAVNAATTSQIIAFQGYTAIRMNITVYGSGNVVFSVRV